MRYLTQSRMYDDIPEAVRQQADEVEERSSPRLNPMILVGVELGWW